MSEQLVYVAIVPKERLETGLAEKVAPIIKKDVRQTRLVLGGKIPKIAGRYGGVQAAESIAQSLKSLGLVAIVCTESDLLRPSADRFRAHTLQLGEREITFWDKDRRSRVVNSESAFLILRGVTELQPQETRTVKTKLDLAATLVTGGIPIVRSVVESTKDGPSETESFLRVYDRASAEPVVEVLQREFDYSGLGKKKAFSSLENLNVIVTEMRRVFPKAIYDARLMSQFRVDVPFATPEDSAEINCKLIYLSYRAVSGSGSVA